MDNPFEYEQEELENCIEIVSEQIEDVDQDKLEL